MNSPKPYSSGRYHSDFLTAVDRTERLGLSLPQVSFSEHQYLTNKRSIDLAPFLFKRFGEFNTDEMVGQCFRFNQKIKPAIEEFFDCPVYFTQGCVFTGANEPRFKMTETQAQDLLRTGMHQPSISTHVWLTLPRMEIIDFTFPTSYGIINKVKECLGAVIANAPEKLIGGWRYEPLLIGDEFLRRVGAFDLFLKRIW